MIKNAQKQQSILIISNRPISYTDNNGKTILSLIKEIPKKNISQLYFYENLPNVIGYNYFQLSDKDVLLGLFNKEKRGRKVFAQEDSEDFIITQKIGIKRSNLLLILRELLWKDKWHSNQLDRWLDDVAPDIIFFMAGDCLFAYQICSYIASRYEAKLFTYITDDYILSRTGETMLATIRRKMLLKCMCHCINISQRFYTICERMRDTYRDVFGKDSEIIFNISDSMYDEKHRQKVTNKNVFNVVYCGSLYYGRDEILLILANTIRSYNQKAKKLAELVVYSNVKPNTEFLSNLEKTGVALYGGSLNSDELKVKMNSCDILVFVESFDKIQIEKTRLSFSTKIPEYLSVGKPILAIGPTNIGSMDALNNVALCVHSKDDLSKYVNEILENEPLRQELAHKAILKYQEINEKVLLPW